MRPALRGAEPAFHGVTAWTPRTPPLPRQVKRRSAGSPRPSPCACCTPTTRACRRPSVELEAAAKLLGALNRIGGNLNQLARHANFGNVGLAHELGEIKADMRATVAFLMAATGRAA